MSDQTFPTDKEVTAEITARLLYLPDEMKRLEDAMTAMRTNVAQSKLEIEEAKKEAVINGSADIANGKNAEHRKILHDQAVKENLLVRQRQAELFEREAVLSNAENEAKLLARKWQAALALAELQAAKINYLARAQRAVNGDRRPA